MLQDIRYGWRMLRRSPGFTAVVVITLCLGIGLNTAVFSVIRAALLRPLPYRNAERLVWVSDHDRSGKGDFPVRNNAFQKWRKQAKSFESIAAFTGLAQSLTTKDGSEYEQVTPVGGDFWKITGAQPEFGRLFGPAESNVVVLSHDLFEQSFHSDPRIVGKIVSLDGHAVTVTGVLSGNFHFLTPGEGLRGQLPQRAVYVPLPEYEPPIVSSPEPKPPS
ncbi:MAG TPA: ABC transporter permease, partial [Bryobacteraceae bacterium]